MTTGWVIGFSALVYLNRMLYLYIMSSVKEIEDAVSHLSPQEFKMFREWFEEYENKLWDLELKKDTESGRLDSFAKEALKEYDEDNCQNL